MYQARRPALLTTETPREPTMNTAHFTRTAARLVARNDRRTAIRRLRARLARSVAVQRVPAQRKASGVRERLGA